MPELPEVETVRRGLEPVFTGAVLDRLELRRSDLRFPFPEGMADRLAGVRVSHMSRRAKYLLSHFENGCVLLMHLGMSGRFLIGEAQATAPGTFYYAGTRHLEHDHVVFHLSREGEAMQVIYNDVRRFGFMDLVEPNGLETNKYLAELGVEPTGNTLSADHLAKAFAKKNTPIKAALLDQRIIAGLGNIYVCEALFMAGISPKRLASSLVLKSGGPSVKLERLTEAIRIVIAKAIEAGGSSLRDYVHTDGELGYFQHQFLVYDRAGERCVTENCGNTVRRVVQSGRSSFYCPSCQR